MVSLPFSDHCEPLVHSPEEFQYLLSSLERDLEKQNWKYIEIRPLNSLVRCQSSLEKTQVFYFHKLDLRPSLDKLFHSFHKDCVQRKIRRAEREALTYEEGRSESLLNKFYCLLLLTRRRQQLPPHPLDWFRNLIDCLGEKLQIRVASKGDRPVASILTLSHKGSLVYKYGCSDASFNNLGGTALLFWKTIQEAKDRGVHEFDLGRSDCDNAGLVTFKDRWGATRSMLTYSRYPAQPSQNVHGDWKMRIAKQMFARMPDGFLTVAGKLLYRHIG
ncbi:MAG: lipid II:glycine glycyltransferase FemX [bacterium]